jgi:anti-repressor protein
MNELIKIQENNGKRAVSARELYIFLEAKERFSNWAKRQFQYGFIEGIDYVGCKEFNTLANQILEDFALTIDCAKEISMLQKNEKGKQARQYFIEIEKRSTAPLTEIEILQRSLGLLIEQQKKVEAIDERVKAIENRPEINAPVEHFSILGYCHNIGKQISLNDAKSYGARCRKLCNQLGFVIGKVSDPRFGSVNTYPLDVLRVIIKSE